MEIVSDDPVRSFRDSFGGVALVPSDEGYEERPIAVER